MTGRHKDGHSLQVIICLGEYFDGMQRRFIASFRQELNLPEGLQLNYKRHQAGYFSDDSDIDWSDEEEKDDNADDWGDAEERRDSCASGNSEATVSSAEAELTVDDVGRRFLRAGRNSRRTAATVVSRVSSGPAASGRRKGSHSSDSSGHSNEPSPRGCSASKPTYHITGSDGHIPREKE